MTYALGAGSKRELVGVHPFLQEVVEEAILHTEQDFAVHDGLRTMEEQRAYVARGVSKTMNSKHMKQPDGYGHAFDLVPYINGKLRWEWKPIYVIAAAVQKAVRVVNQRRAAAGQPTHKLRWGGVWDLPFETLGDTPEQLEKAVQDYVSRRRAAGKNAFIDGPHFERVS